MKFQEAKEKLDEKAGGKYHKLSYELVTGNYGNEEAKCSIYIHGGDIHSAPTWEECFDLLAGKNHITVDTEQEPE